MYPISNYSWISEPGLWTRQVMFLPQMGKNSYLAGLEVSFHHPFTKHPYHKQWRLKIKSRLGAERKSFTERDCVSEG